MLHHRKSLKTQFILSKIFFSSNLNYKVWFITIGAEKQILEGGTDERLEKGYDRREREGVNERDSKKQEKEEKEQ